MQLKPSMGSENQETDWQERISAYYYLAKMLLSRYWWILLLCVAGGLGYQSWKAMSLETVYLSHSRMVVNGRISIQDGPAYREEISNFFGTQIELMTSPAVYERAMERVIALNPKLRPTRPSLTARQQPSASIFMLQATGADPDFTQKFLDAIMEEYIAFRRDMREQTSSSTLQAITLQLDKIEQEINQQENAVVDFQKENNLVFLKEQGNTAGSYLARLKNNQAELKTQLLLLDGLDLNGTADPTISAADGSKEDMLKLTNLDFAKDYFQTSRQLESLKAELSDYSQYLKPRHPKIIKLNQDIERTNNLVQILRAQAIARIDEQRQLMKKQIHNLDRIILDWEVIALDTSRKTAEFDRMNSRLERMRGTQLRLSESLKSIDMNQKIDQDPVSVLDRASTSAPIGTALQSKLTNGALMGFLVGVALLVGLRMVDNRIVSTEDIKTRFEAPVLSIIPLEKRNKSGQLTLLQPKDDRHLFAEACRTLRSSLLFMKGPNGPISTIVVSSSIPEEGKSTIAANLAVALAFTSSKIILVDTDLRRGHLCKAFGITQHPGLSEYLIGGITLDSVIHKTSIPDLDFIASGEYPERPGELLLSNRMDGLIIELRKRYEYVIFDSAPILATDDTAGFSAKADALLFVVRSTHTQVRQIMASVERLELRGTKVQGYVLNCVDVRGSDYYYYKKYNYYSARTKV
ncbi:MAG: polysaccharide biosynthesis tyrosine autokinase [Verrucomicrobiota bacterium]|nr:polysaccharide biosynthesis tyrosine autokinase [Verrucomicrobiota bacterium]